MPYVKTMKRTNKDGTVRIYYYLAESYRAEGKMKTRILKPLTAKEAEAIDRQKGKDIVRIQDTSKVKHYQLPLDIPKDTIFQPITLAELDHYLLTHGRQKGIGVMAYKKARIQVLEGVNAILEERS